MLRDFEQTTPALRACPSLLRRGIVQNSTCQLLSYVTITPNNCTNLALLPVHTDAIDFEDFG
jgi:hypothetical protein